MASERLKLYNTITSLRRTHRDRDSLRAMPDPAAMARVLMRGARNLGLGPMETLRRHLDAESAAVARRLRELEGKA